MQINPYKRIYLLVLLSVMFTLFFWGGPDLYSPRSLKYFWNLGHIIFFALLPLFFVPSLRRSHSDKYAIICILIGTLVMGIIIEFLQSDQNGRIRDLGDIVRNIIGVLFYWAFLSPFRKHLIKSRILLVQGLLIVLLFLQLAPIAKARSLG